MGASKKKLISRFDSMAFAAFSRLAKTAALKLSFLISSAFLIHTICTQIMPASDNTIIKIRPMNFL
jgi:hypothetical protein